MIHFKPIDKQDVNTISALMVDFLPLMVILLLQKETKELLDQFLESCIGFGMALF
jgi:hypothetical protein